MKKHTLLISLIALTGCLTACHHDNPLLSKPKKQAVKIIQQAEQTAMASTKLYYGASVYLECMNHPKHFNSPGKTDGQSRCNKLFKAMLYTIRQHKGFSSLSFDQLTDPRAAKKLSNSLVTFEG